jgi:hypothetical protein
MKNINKTIETKNDRAISNIDLGRLTHKDDPVQVIEKAKKEVALGNEQFTSSPDDVIFQALTLNEFDNGSLLCMATHQLYKTFGIDLMRKLQGEYGCLSASEKATAELASISFVRALDAQRRIKNYLDIGEFTAIGVQYMAVMGKELDRANRHYLTAIQTLRMLKQPPMQLNIRANTAVVGQNQIVQANTNNEPK